MSIFGVKRKHVDASGLERKMQSLVNSLNDKHRLLNKKVMTISDKITICAESKGPLQKNEVFSFGNGGREGQVGYITVYPIRILAVGVSSKRKSGELNIGIAINGVEYPGYDITLGENVFNHHVFFDRYFEVLPGKTINFICKNNNSTAVDTVACLMIEIIN